MIHPVAAADRSRAFVTPPALTPPPASRVEDMDVSEHLLIDIAMRHIYLRGTCTIKLLGNLMKLPLELTEALFRRLNDQGMFEVRRMEGDDYLFALSPTGRRIAVERASTLRYAGPVPVSLKSWTDAVRAQAVDVNITRPELRAAFNDIIVPDSLLDALGPALCSRTSLFLYGPSGTGKTTISERLLRVYRDTILVPYAVEIQGQIVMLADPALHQSVSFDNLYIDPRWMVCRRPFVAVGGELVASMLELQKDEGAGAFVAPLQMKANNGLLLIDDFGRQLMSPRDLLNRWIVPLDRRVDFLSIGSGQKFDVPFEILVVFSTNLEPRELADDAFLRRVPNKILVAGIEPAAFDLIFYRTAETLGLRYEHGAAQYCRELCLRHSPDLRPCYPRDICNAIRAIRLYEGREPAIAREDLDRAVAGYFVS
ncbi:MAG: AAA family ATPase [Acidobacteriota bacterium]|nr:AAA family ATPase [Acidobacteriota bacterium]